MLTRVSRGGKVVWSFARRHPGAGDWIPPEAEGPPVGAACGRAALPRGARMLGALGAAPSRPRAAPTGRGMRQDAWATGGGCRVLVKHLVQAAGGQDPLRPV